MKPRALCISTACLQLKPGALCISRVCVRLKLVARFVSMVCLLSMPGSILAQATQENPSRAVGYLLGDVLTQRTALQGENASADISDLQEPARIGPWLERRYATIVRDADGQRWLELRYQVVNVPTTLAEVSLPGVTVSSRDGAPAKPLRIAPWTFTLSPMLPAIDSGATTSESISGASSLPRLQPDRTPEPLDVVAKRQRLILTTVALAGVLLGWLGWWLWRNHHDCRHLPFNRAYRSLQSSVSPADDAPLAAWKAMHEAFNQTAGRTIQTSSVPILIERERWLAPNQERIEAFYRASAARFFRQPCQSEPFMLQELARDLAKAERQ